MSCPKLKMIFPSSCTYSSQLEYEYGEFICISACILWSMAVIRDSIKPICSTVNMDNIMRLAVKLHKLSNGGNASIMPQQHEILETIPFFFKTNLPETSAFIGDCTGLISSEKYVYDSRILSGERFVQEMDCIDIHDLFEFCHDRTAVIMTTNFHTTCIVNINHEVFFFNPLVAKVIQIEKNMFLNILTQSHGKVIQMTVNKIYF